MISVICSRCGGTGQLTYLQGTSAGYQLSQKCAQIPWIAEICPKCEGKGQVQELSFEERKETKNDPFPKASKNEELG